MKNHFVIAIAVLLTACSSSSDSGSDSSPSVSECRSIFGGGTTVVAEDASCTGCELREENKIIDGNVSTAGNLITASATTGFTGVRVTAQDGLVFASGSQAGVIVGARRRTNVESGSLVIRTYLGGVQQEQQSVQTNGVAFNGTSNAEPRLYAFRTNFQYDAVAFGLLGSANGLDIDFYEFCSD